MKTARSSNATKPSATKPAATKSDRNTAGSGADQDAIALLKSDHREVDELVQQYESARSDRKEALARRICQALTVHAQIEEELVYPAAREALESDDTDLIDEADVEHASIKQLVQDVEDSEPSDDHFDAKVKVIGEYVKHHVQEEERELFPKLRESGLDLEELGKQLAERKAALTQELRRSA